MKLRSKLCERFPRKIYSYIVYTFYPNATKSRNAPQFANAFLKLDSFDQFLVSGKGLKNYMLLYNSETCMLVVVKRNNFHMHLAGKLSHL